MELRGNPWKLGGHRSCLLFEAIDRRSWPLPEILLIQKSVIMESINFDWLDDDYPLSYETPEFPTASNGQAVELAANPTAERPGQPSGDTSLALLRSSGGESNKRYDRSNPHCIHYDFRWKVSQRENIRARHICSDTVPDLILAPSDFWKVDFQPRLESVLTDKDKFPGERYTCEETIIEISIERSRQRGTKRCDKMEVDWDAGWRQAP